MLKVILLLQLMRWHNSDHVVADALRSLKAHQQDVKFLGSYPAAGESGPTRRAEVDAARRDADAWMDDLLGRVGD
jgi:prephenate dehydratase